MMGALPQIGCLWIGDRLGFIEKLCLISMRDQGHRVTLFTYGPVGYVPEGIRIQDAREIYQGDHIYRHARTGSPAVHSDLFRLHLLRADPGVIWADTDAYCRKPWQPVAGHYYGWESDLRIASGLLALPPDSPALKAMLEMLRDEYFIPPWLNPAQMQVVQQAHLKGQPLHMTELGWGMTGPRMLSYALQQSGEASFAQPPEVLYPIGFEDRNLYFRRPVRVLRRLTDLTASVHLYGRRVRARLEKQYHGTPPPGSYLAYLGRQHGLITSD